MTIYDLIDDDTRDKLNADHRFMIRNKEKQYVNSIGLRMQEQKRLDDMVMVITLHSVECLQNYAI